MTALLRQWRKRPSGKCVIADLLHGAELTVGHLIAAQKVAVFPCAVDAYGHDELAAVLGKGRIAVDALIAAGQRNAPYKRKRLQRKEEEVLSVFERCKQLPVRGDVARVEIMKPAHLKALRVRIAAKYAHAAAAEYDLKAVCLNGEKSTLAEFEVEHAPPFSRNRDLFVHDVLLPPIILRLQLFGRAVLRQSLSKNSNFVNICVTFYADGCDGPTALTPGRCPEQPLR